MEHLYSLIFAFVGIIIQHPLHELSHVAMAKIFGEKVTRIQWLTYQGGTRVFYQNEPDFNMKIPKKWAWISSAGYLTTNLCGYLLVLIYFLLPNGMVKAFVCILSIVFLLADSSYFVLGSVFNFGDVIGIKKTLNISKTLTIAISSLVLAFNCFIIWKAFY